MLDGLSWFLAPKLIITSSSVVNDLSKAVLPIYRHYCLVPLFSGDSLQASDHARFLANTIAMPSKQRNKIKPCSGVSHLGTLLDERAKFVE